MKPESLVPSFNTDRLDVEPKLGVEQTGINKGAEIGNNSSSERYIKRAEPGAILADVNLTTFLPTPVVSTDDDVQQTTIGATPLVANDDDLIEKEWVDKAKKIVLETTNNPYGREEAVNKLQVDYLNKRYGRKLGVAE